MAPAQPDGLLQSNCIRPYGSQPDGLLQSNCIRPYGAQPDAVVLASHKHWRRYLAAINISIGFGYRSVDQSR